MNIITHRSSKWASWIGLALLLGAGLYGLPRSFSSEGDLLLLGLSRFVLAVPGLVLVHLCVCGELTSFPQKKKRPAGIVCAVLALLAIGVTSISEQAFRSLLLDGPLQRSVASRTPISALNFLKDKAVNDNNPDERAQAARVAYELYRYKIQYRAADSNLMLMLPDSLMHDYAEDMISNVTMIEMQRLFVLPVILVNLWGLIIWILGCLRNHDNL